MTKMPPAPTSASVRLTTVGRPSSQTLDCMQAVVVVKPAHARVGVPHHVNIGADVCALLKTATGHRVKWGTPAQSNVYTDGTASICRIHTAFRATEDVDFLTQLCAAVAAALRMDVATLSVERECAHLTLKTRETVAGDDDTVAKTPPPPPPLARAERFGAAEKTSTITSLVDVGGLFPPLSELLFGTGTIELIPAPQSVDAWLHDASARLPLPKRFSETQRRVDQQTKVQRTLESDRTRMLEVMRDGKCAGIF